MTENHIETLLQETQWVRKLLTLLALSPGYKQKHIAAALGVSEATMSRMMPKDLPTFAAPPPRGSR